jgi:glycosyltransferase involved in cell wall biosynthesis
MLGLFVQRHAEAVQLLHDVEVLYVTADKALHPGKVIVDESVHEGIHETRIYFGKHDSEPANAFGYVKYYIKGLHLITRKRGKIDLAHVHVLTRAAIPALWLKYTSGIPYIITEHWSRYLPDNVAKGAYSGQLRKWFTRFAVTSASAVTTVTQNLADAMIRLGLKNKYFVVPNVADTVLFYPAKEKADHSVKKLIHVSCFDEPAKNIKGIINVISKLAVERNDFTLEIIGDGVDFTDVKQHAENTGLVGTRIFLTGLLTGEALASRMRNAEALVMFSNYENLPCTIVESICSGVPVISSDVGGIREHVKSDNGMLVNAGDEAGLESAIRSLLTVPLRFNSAKIHGYGEEHFSMKKIAGLFESIYSQHK